MAGVRGAYLLVAEGHARHDVLAEEYLEHGTRVRQRRFHSPLLEELQQPSPVITSQRSRYHSQLPTQVALYNSLAAYVIYTVRKCGWVIQDVFIKSAVIRPEAH